MFSETFKVRHLIGGMLVVSMFLVGIVCAVWVIGVASGLVQ